MTHRLRPVTRRHALGCCAAAVAGLFTSLAATPAPAAPWNPCRDAEVLPTHLRDAVARAFDGLDPAQVWDVHTHVLGNGDAGSGCTIHPSLVAGFNLLERGRHAAILNAACVARDAASIDRAYVARLQALAAGFPPGAKWLLFAFDHAHDDAGRAQPERSTFHVPDAYAASLARAQPARFGWVASVHPYAGDALARLDAAIARGALAIKWLPSAMNIDLRHPRCAPFYARLAAARLPLIVHSGEERAVPGAGRHDLGNPLHLRAPLAQGVRVIAAHCASLGTAPDLDLATPTEVPAFSLFARLMDERVHEGRLLGDISAVFQTNRDASVWRTLLARRDWHPRLLHGSDHPLPGLMLLHRPGAWVRAGLITKADGALIDALRAHNPLLADFVLKRLVRLDGAALPAAVFETRRHFAAPGT